MITFRTAWFAALALLAPLSALAQVTVFEENFFGDGDPLNGKTPDMTTAGEVWEAGDEWGDDGIHFSPTAGGQAAHLDYVPQPGRIYTASLRVSNRHANAMGFGFFADDPLSGDWTAENNAITHADNLGYAWIKTSNSSADDQAGYMGLGELGDQPWAGDVINTNQPIDLDIVLDTTLENWTVQWFLDGASQGSPTAFTGAGNPGIGGIGLSRQIDPTTNSTFIQTSQFSLTYVPEPTSLVLLGFGALILVQRKQASA